MQCCYLISQVMSRSIRSELKQEIAPLSIQASSIRKINTRNQSVSQIMPRYQSHKDETVRCCNLALLLQLVVKLQRIHRLRIYANIANQTVGRMLVSSSRSHCSKLKCYTILQRSTASNEFNFIQHSQHYHPAVTVRTMLHFHLLSKFQFYCSEKSSNCKLSDGVNANFHWKLLLFIYSGFPSSFNKI